MAAVGVSAEEAERFLAPYLGKVSLAAVNSSSSVTFSGDAAALNELGAELQSRQVFYRPLRLQYAFHSPTMDP
jgi:acyl transferase domain-containing protein